MNKACSLQYIETQSCIHDSSGAASLPRKAHHKMLALLLGLPLPGFIASCFVQTVEVGKAWDILLPLHTVSDTAHTFSGFSVGCCIGKAVNKDLLPT